MTPITFVEYVKMHSISISHPFPHRHTIHWPKIDWNMHIVKSDLSWYRSNTKPRRQDPTGRSSHQPSTIKEGVKSSHQPWTIKKVSNPITILEQSKKVSNPITTLNKQEGVKSIHQPWTIKEGVISHVAATLYFPTRWETVLLPVNKYFEELHLIFSLPLSFSEIEKN